MAIIKSTIKAGQQPSREELKRINAEVREAKKHPINFKDFPELTPAELAELRPARQDAPPSLRVREFKSRQIAIKMPANA